MLLTQSSRSLKVSFVIDLSSKRKHEPGDIVWVSPLTAEIVDVNSAKHCRSQLYDPWPNGFGPRVRRRRREASCQPDSTCTATSVVDRSEDREADRVGCALTAPIAMDDSAQCSFCESVGTISSSVVPNLVLYHVASSLMMPGKFKIFSASVFVPASP